MEYLRKLLTPDPNKAIFSQFELAAHDLLHNWEIVLPKGRYQLMEIEFFYNCPHRKHLDFYITKSPVEKLFGHWYFHNGGASLTIGDDVCVGSVQFKSVKNIETGAFIHGPQRVFREIFEDAGIAIEPSGMAKLQRTKKTNERAIIAVPRVGLNLTEFSKDLEQRIEYLLKPYRFIRTDATEFADKYVAYLYLDKVSKMEVQTAREESIYKKYLEAFDLGLQVDDMNVVWIEHSKLIRLAILMGMQQKRGTLITPELSNEESPEF